MNYHTTIKMCISLGHLYVIWDLGSAGLGWKLWVELSNPASLVCHLSWTRSYYVWHVLLRTKVRSARELLTTQSHSKDLLISCPLKTHRPKESQSHGQVQSQRLESTLWLQWSYHMPTDNHSGKNKLVIETHSLIYFGHFHWYVNKGTN